ncbi:RNA 2',3'-cyclic phosphodiesterase [Colwellia sp. MB02u-18]|uniref:RNA 2',3'-cyclic phosphodiesterase n=1 Tax=unclassified Colwellia TaxID=196834 RepID=UPI0015F7712B|nr:MULTISPECIES: RNA 2',3'-cyclic phosphodiesterase [unclassified Colwellia]MBA6224628.1 RNA 2',3'-cyclic phosphodiesterase [Colwellia sp. MB3u-45]MBA6268060.1 RNA 2',3'-cyclic phosphodiesterase [Colwellia sp. MB3u-43]MBA6322512.1 RNA 2',3'-cyclic phosphodiesterase [Colwellia sp. MB02u-19]MBA6326090.1 RNA 2',3'-cyclic phosphodiesterase [Colwellia sp. MB02u-18]MBA6331549.1 RNA 2',3'-cyclic phosphodiesterase [Colwellia sp. MB02u-12]
MKKRMFIALDIIDTDKVKIAQWREQHLSLPFKPIDRQNFHITLAFLGCIAPQQQASVAQLISQQHGLMQQRLKALIQQKKASSILLSQLGYFKKAQVLHLMPASCPDWLIYLQHTVVELSLSSNIALENRSYQPHLSLYRKAKTPLPALCKHLQQSVFKQQLSITSFSLYHSYSTALGVRYEPVQTWTINF